MPTSEIDSSPDKKHRIFLDKKLQWISIAKIAVLSLLLGGCAELVSSENIQNLSPPSIMDPQGYGAVEIATLWWIIFIVATVVFIIVIGLLLVALWRPRDRSPIEESSARDRFLVIGGGVVIPIVILAVIYILTLNTMAVLANTIVSDEIVIKVIGYQWWWEVQYPNQEVTTANEIHIPVGTPIRIEVESADVIHSFWVPELHGKIDMIPGQTNVIDLQANEPGVYFGECAEFCGTQHAKMAFVLVAESSEQFDSWVDQQSQPATEPTESEAQQGKQVFLISNCAQCHTIKGTDAAGTLGPDLTHLASRRTLAAGMLPNTRGNLGGWMLIPRALNPGT